MSKSGQKRVCAQSECAIKDYLEKELFEAIAKLSALKALLKNPSEGMIKAGERYMNQQTNLMIPLYAKDILKVANAQLIKEVEDGL